MTYCFGINKEYLDSYFYFFTITKNKKEAERLAKKEMELND